MVFRLLSTFCASCASLIEKLNQEECKVLEKLLNKIHVSIKAKVGEGR